MEFRRAKRWGRATGARSAPVPEKRFRVNRRSRVLALTALLAGFAVVSSFVALWAAGDDRGGRVPITNPPNLGEVVAAGSAASYYRTSVHASVAAGLPSPRNLRPRGIDSAREADAREGAR